MNYQFRFSVIMAVYQVERYIRKAINSIVHQTIGFEHIQLILVDDGSTDGSGAICDEFKKQYPDQVEVIHKQNGGVSSAKNAGISLAQGKYVSFLDPDDYLDKRTFKYIESFMDHQGKKADVCCIPMVLFGARKGEHVLNDKFKSGTRVINLLEEENAGSFQMSNASAFYRLETVKRMSFDERLATAEDAKENCKILINNPNLGILADAKYYYRKHDDSAIAKCERNVRWYIPHTKYFDQWVLNQAVEKYGFVPLFVQNMVMYDIQGKLKQSRVPEGVLDEEEEAEYRNLIYECISQINDEVILRNNNLSTERKAFILKKKSELNKVSFAHRTKQYQWKKEATYTGQKERGSQTFIGDILTVVPELFKMDSQKHLCSLEGHFRIISGLDSDDLNPIIVINDNPVFCEKIDRRSASGYFIGEKMTESIGFRGFFSVSEKITQVQFILKKGTRMHMCTAFEAGNLFPITTVYENAYAIRQNLLIRFNQKGIEIIKNPSVFCHYTAECRWLAEIWKKHLNKGRRAIVSRTYYHVARLFKKRRLWIVSDTIMKADDNGEAFYLYSVRHKPQNTRIIYAISKNSADYQRMKKNGPCIKAPSIRYSLLYLLCDTVVSSSSDSIVIHPAGYNDAIRDLVTRPKYINLQNSVIYDEQFGCLNRYNIKLDGLVTASKPEWESIVHEENGFPEKNIWLTGFPRFDRLYHDEQRMITICPTWRNLLLTEGNGKKEKRETMPDFPNSEYYLFYHQLLNSERLLSTAEILGYTIQFYLKPSNQTSEIDFDPDQRVKRPSVSISYRELFAMSNLVVTDYLSMVFDFSYLRKPVLYWQFDKDSVLSGEHMCSPMCFDYENDGFGEVEYDLDSLIDRIIEYMKNDCVMKPKYRERIDRFFAFHDQNSSQRVMEKVLSLDTEG